VTDLEAGHFERPQTSTRDRVELHRRLVDWLGKRLPDPLVSKLGGPDTNGMSSETLLFDIEWDENGFTRTQACAARLSPDAGSMPVFPSYDLERQFRVMGLVRERTDGRHGLRVEDGRPVNATIYGLPKSP